MDTVVGIVGNKTDKETRIPKEEAAEFAERNALLCFYTSTMTREGVDEVMPKLIRDTMTGRCVENQNLPNSLA
jgi:hypothetical protein